MILKRGSKGAEVGELQKLLHIYVDNVFGPNTEEAVKEFQKANGLVPDGIVGPQTWEKLKGSSLAKSSRKITELIVHCTATPEGKDYTVEDIRRWHKAKGWSDIGYHYVIYRDGSIHAGRNVNIGGAHCVGHNTYSIGIVYVGGVDKYNHPKDTRTPQQKASLITLLTQLKRMYPKATIHGHYEFSSKACPCFKPKLEYANIKG